MKTKTILIASVVILASLLAGALFLQVNAPQPLTVNMTFDPNTMDLGAPGSILKEVLVTLWFSTGKYDGRDIDPKTVMIEEVLGPKGGWKNTWTEQTKTPDHSTRWVFRFVVAAGGLKDILWTKIGHMGEVSVTVPLTVTGNLYSGTAFSGIGYITCVDPIAPTPNPPPA